MKIDGRRNNGSNAGNDAHRNEKRNWGKGITKYCPKNKVCWSISKSNKLVIYKDLPTYGLERIEIPENLKQGGR